MATEDIKVHELVEWMRRGVLRLPEMQRRYVWRATRVRDLFDSLYRGYPSGTILLWETDEEVPEQEMAIAHEGGMRSSGRLLLDGQQRLTSLAAVILGESVKVKGREKPIELMFNLDHPDQLAFSTEVYENADMYEGEEASLLDGIDASDAQQRKNINNMTFVVKSRKLVNLPHWVDVSEVFANDNDSAFLSKAGIKDLGDPNYNRYNKRLNRLRNIRNYSYRVDVLERSLSYNAVTDIFVRVNSLGAKLRGADLALAQITAKWKDSLKGFLSYEETIKKQGFSLDLGSVHLRNLIVFTTGQCGFHTIGGLNENVLQQRWKESCRGMDFILNFVKSNIGIDSSALLSSPFLLISAAYFCFKRDYKLSPEDAEDLKHWLLVVNAKGRYSRGAAEALLNDDLIAIKNDCDIKDLVDLAVRYVGKLDVSPDDLKGRSQLSALFKTMFLAFREKNAQDWYTGLKIAIDHAGSQDKLQFHHIFPKGVLRGSYKPREVNDIANLCFISGKTNRKISAKAPNEYFPALIDKLGEDPFKAQCIPTDRHLLEVRAYPDFLAERRKLIATRLNEFLQPDRWATG